MRIHHVTIEPVRVTTAAAELRVVVEWDGPTDGVEFRGRLVGPRCNGVSTVEVAYPLRLDASALRVVIPEPNMWSTAAPFRYDGRVEAWVGSERVDEHTFAVELRPASGG